MNKLQILDDTPKKYHWKGNKKQRQAMEYWLDTSSNTFGNAYRSWLKAGFSESYSKNIMNIAPKYVSDFIDRLDLSEEHIVQGIQSMAISSPNSKSPDDTRIKAWELLAKIKGMVDNKQTTTNILVQPILGGQSVIQGETRVKIDNTKEDKTIEIPIDK